MDAHILLSPVGQKTETRFNCLLTENRKSTEMVGTPSTVRKLLPPLRRSPSLEEGGLGAARALSKILIQLRVQGRNPARFNGGYGVPSGARLLLPPLRRFPSLKEGGLGFRRSRPPALPSIAYRGFAVAPITLRAPSRRFLYNSGSRVATLVVSMGVMGFLGDLREDRSRARPVGGSARRSIPSEREQPCCDL